MKFFIPSYPKSKNLIFGTIASFIFLLLAFFSDINGITGRISFTFLPIVITGQEEVQVLYKGEVTIQLDQLIIDYNGNLADLSLSVLDGNPDIYTVNGNTITATVDYQTNWPAQGQEITIDVQVSDGTDTEEFELKVLVIPPILPLSYNENSCQGTISLTASAYKPEQFFEGSFPFVFKLIDGDGVVLSEVEVNNAAAFQTSASVTFGDQGEILDRQENYIITVEDNLGRTYSRNSGPLGEAYSLDFELNFSGMVCADDQSGVVEFIVFNAALPFDNFLITDEDDNEVPVQLDIIDESGGFIVVQATNLGAGKYTLQIADSFTCTGDEDFEIVIPGPILPEAEIGNVSCPNESDGFIRLLIEGGWSQPFQGNPREDWAQYVVEWFSEDGTSIGAGERDFIEDNGSIIEMEALLAGLPPGNYYAEIRDKGRLFEVQDNEPLECMVTTPIFTIEGPEPLVLNSDFQPVSCFGDGNGQITINPEGGTPELTISWYKGKFLDPQMPDETGLEGFNPGPEDDDFQRINLEEGDYAVLVRDANGCFLTENFTIEEPAPLAISEVEEDRINVVCFGEATGSITVQIDQVTTGPYLFQIHEAGENPGSTQEFQRNETTAQVISNLTVGSYEVMVSDTFGCLQTISNIEIDGPLEGLKITGVLLSDYNGFQVSCEGANDGNITVEVNTAPEDLTFAWTGPGGFEATTKDIEILAPGAYELIITEENTCTATTGTIELNAPLPLSLNEEIPDLNGFQITCNGSADGFIQLNPSGGVGNYTFIWIGPNGFSSDASSVENLGPGNYELTLSDANGCELVSAFELNEPEELELEEIAEEKLDVACFGQQTGALAVAVSNPSTGPYTYYLQFEDEALGSVDQSEGTNDTTWVFREIGAGNYEVTVEDGNGCIQNIGGLMINQPTTGIQIDDVRVSEFNGFNISCFGAGDGQIEVVFSGGSGNYVFEWTGPNGYTSDQPSIVNLGPGNYQLNILDENGCSLQTEPLEIVEPAPLNLNSEMGDFNGFGISCFGNNDGWITINPSGGSENYAISWSGPDGFSTNEPSIEDLAPGLYEVNLEDENGCFISEQFEISEPDLLEVTLVDKEDVLCFGDSTGSINLMVQGGSSNDYRFEWSRDGALITESTQDLSDIPAGTYEVSVYEDNNCVTVLSGILIDQPEAALEVVMSQTEISCYNANDADLSIDINGGEAPYQISWNVGSTQQAFSGIGAGFYQVTVIDANGCTVIRETTIEDLPVYDVAPEVQHISCYGGNEGSIDLNLVGGEAPVRAQWDHGPEQSALFNLTAGAYGVTITEANGCVIRREFNIIEPDLLVVAEQVQDALSCEDGQSGFINLTVSGGTPPYIYDWSNGETTAGISNLTNGTYSVNITDQSGCFVSQIFRVNRPAPIQVNRAATLEVQCDPREIVDVFDLHIGGGVAPYDIQWSNGEVRQNGYQMITSEPGTYFLTIVDGYGCQYTESFEVDNHRVLLDASYKSASYAQFQANLANFDVQFINNSSGKIREYHWDFGDGNKSTLKAPVHRYMSEGTYEITLVATDEYDCQTNALLEIQIWDYFLEIPNIFSPNGDGINDFFFPKFLHLSSLDFTIMNKWGEIVFHTKDLDSKGWDGFYRGDAAIPGNYVYKLTYTSSDGRTGSKNGVFMLMK